MPNYQHTSAIRCVIVTAKDGKVGFLSDGHLSDVRHEVGEVFGGVFAQSARRVSSHRVEVAKGNDVPLLYCRSEWVKYTICVCVYVCWSYIYAYTQPLYTNAILTTSPRPLLRDPWASLQWGTWFSRTRWWQRRWGGPRWWASVRGPRTPCMTKRTPGCTRYLPSWPVQG